MKMHENVKFNGKNYLQLQIYVGFMQNNAQFLAVYDAFSYGKYRKHTYTYIHEVD